MSLRLRPRLLLTLFLVIIVALGTVGLYGTSATYTEFQRYIDSESTRRARSMAELLIHYRQARTWENVQPLLEQMARITGDRIVLADSSGLVIADSSHALPTDPQSQRIFDILEGQILDQSLGVPTVLISSRDTPMVYVYIISGSGEAGRAAVFFGTINRQLLWAVVSAGLVGLLLVLFFSRSILRPVEALTAAARAMEKGDLSQRVEASSRDEIGELARAFNAMADGLARQEKLRRNMVSDVAHELRTPLANIRGYLEAVRDGVTEPSAELIRSLHEEAMLLNHLVNDLQDLAAAEAGVLTLHRQPMAIDEVLQRAVHQFRSKAGSKDLALELDVPTDLPLVEADDERISQVVRNLLTNAIHYSAAGGRITVSARAENGNVEVSVTDTGIGIEPEHLPYIFERFYRTDWSRTRATGGTGLGLAIARQWVEAHGGKIRAQSTYGQGASILFSLPVSEVQLEQET